MARLLAAVSLAAAILVASPQATGAAEIDQGVLNGIQSWFVTPPIQPQGEPVAWGWRLRNLEVAAASGDAYGIEFTMTDPSGTPLPAASNFGLFGGAIVGPGATTVGSGTSADGLTVFVDFETASLGPNQTVIANQPILVVADGRLTVTATRSGVEVFSETYDFETGDGDPVLEVSKTGPTEVSRGSDAVYSIQVANNGTGPARGVSVSDLIGLTSAGSEVTFVEAGWATATVTSTGEVSAGSAGNCVPFQLGSTFGVECQEWDLDVGETIDVTVTVATAAFPPFADAMSDSAVAIDAKANTAASPTVATTIEAPVEPVALGPIPSQTVDELSPLTLTASATGPADAVIEYSFVGAPPTGATIDGGTGAFAWTPAEDQGPDVVTVVVRATDTVGGGSDEEKFDVTVNEVNRAPTLAEMPPQAIVLGETLDLEIAANDSDIPANGVSYRLVAPPAGAAIDESTGALTFSPATAGSFDLVVEAIDDGSPPLSDSITIEVTVEDPSQPLSLGFVVTGRLSSLSLDEDGLSRLVVENLDSRPAEFEARLPFDGFDRLLEIADLSESVDAFSTKVVRPDGIQIDCTMTYEPLERAVVATCPVERLSPAPSGAYSYETTISGPLLPSNVAVVRERATFTAPGGQSVSAPASEITVEPGPTAVEPDFECNETADGGFECSTTNTDDQTYPAQALAIDVESTTDFEFSGDIECETTAQGYSCFSAGDIASGEQWNWSAGPTDADATGTAVLTLLCQNELTCTPQTVTTEFGVPRRDLAVKVREQSATVLPGQDIVVDVTFTNLGTSTGFYRATVARALQNDDGTAIPTFPRSDGPPGHSCLAVTGRPMFCSGNLEAGESVTIAITFPTPSNMGPGQLSVSASLESADDDPSNDVAATVVRIVDTPFITIDERAGQPGDTIEATMDGLPLLTGTQVFIASEPVLLGTFTSDAEGRLTASVVIPDGTEPGRHEIVVRSEWPDGPEVEARTPVVILPAAEDRQCTIIGTNRADILVGTSGDDVICGLGGNDVILGRGGSDVIFGDGGRDIIRGGPGGDLIDGGAGWDHILGNQGNDTIVGGAGRDRVLAGKGSDILIGGADADLLRGGRGDDELYGGNGPDSLRGGPGIDILDGGPGRDTCTAGRVDRRVNC